MVHHSSPQSLANMAMFTSSPHSRKYDNFSIHLTW